MVTVLVLVEQQQVRSVLVRQLVLEGFDVASAGAADEARERFRATPADVLVLGLNSSETSLNFLSWINTVAPHVPAVVLHDDWTEEERRQASALGAIELLARPVEPADCVSCIQTLACEGQGFRGWVHGVSLIDLLQIFHYARRTLTLTVEQIGTLQFQDGEIVHAEAGQQIGEEALRTILQAPRGTIRTSGSSSPQTSIARTFQSVLLDCLRLVDESARDEEDHPAVGHPEQRLFPQPTGVISIRPSGSPSLDGLPSVPPRGPFPPRHSLAPGFGPSAETILTSCKLLAKRVEGCVGVALVDLDAGTLLALHWPGTTDPTDAIAQATSHMFASDSVSQLDRLLSRQRQDDHVEEVRFSNQRMTHLAKRLSARNAALVLLAEDASSSALCWSELRQTAHTIERLLS